MNGSESEVNDLTEPSKIQDSGNLIIASAYIYYANFSVRSALAGVFRSGLAVSKTGRENTTKRRCDRSESEGSEQIFDLTGALKRKNSSVTKREETTRSHPEHGRKDS